MSTNVSSEPKIAVVDYKLGNMYSVLQACKSEGLNAEVVASPDGLNAYDGIILPGVGAYGDAMENLKTSGMAEALFESAHAGTPILGICLGMQLLVSKSEEFGDSEGLGLIPGAAKKLPRVQSRSKNMEAKIPLVGWNRIVLSREGKVGSADLFKGSTSSDFYYFVHSFHVANVPEEYVVSTSFHEDFEYISAIRKSNIVGYQFHPEKSADQGKMLYRNWAASFV